MGMGCKGGSQFILVKSGGEHMAWVGFQAHQATVSVTEKESL